jgi:murein DD-endopeptidase MepM/ murein hydrolase activator NlpD
LFYDGHDGTDFRTRAMTNMRTGVEVLAAAPGVVMGTHNMMEDVLVGDIGCDSLEGRDASNGVRIDHGNATRLRIMMICVAS